MARLLAVRDVGPAFVTALARAWDNGDAVLPVDPRLPATAAASLETTMRVGEEVEPGDALVVATSGTTGVPKGVVLTHAAVEAAAHAVHRRLDVDSDRDRWLACLPVAHVGGLSVVCRAMITGTPLTVLDRFEAHAVAAAGAAGCTLVSLVTRALRQIDPRVFRCVVLGGGPAPDDAPTNAVVTYGLTESGGGVVYNGTPLDGTDVRIDGADGESGESGEILLRGPSLLRAYRDGTDPKDAEGWLRTGDVGQIDDDGRLRVHGRHDDLIITGGENVWPRAVERRLLDHPAVADVAVVGHVDADWGHRVVAYIETAPGVSPLPLATMRAWAKERLPAYAIPRSIVWMDALPRTALGKVRRAALAAPMDLSGPNSS